MQDTGKERKSCLGCSIIAVCGWLVCAAMCLWLTISLEGYPRAYSLAYPAAMAVLFSNIFVFSSKILINSLNKTIYIKIINIIFINTCFTSNFIKFHKIFIIYCFLLFNCFICNLFNIFF